MRLQPPTCMASRGAAVIVRPDRSQRLPVSARCALALVFDYRAARDQLVVGRPAENIVTVFEADLLFRDGYD
jgi:hypothetical protein